MALGSRKNFSTVPIDYLPLPLAFCTQCDSPLPPSYFAPELPYAYLCRLNVELFDLGEQ